MLLASAASLRGAWLVGAFLSLSLRHLAAYVVRRDGARAVPPRRAAGAGARGRRRLRPAAGPARGVDRHRAVRAHQADPAAHVGVLVSVLPVTVLLGLAVPGPPWLAAAWLGPALALVPVLLALAAFVGPRTAATVVSLVWSGVVLGSTRALAPTWPVEAAQQGVYLGLAVAACAVIAIRAGADRQPGVAL